MIINRSFTFLAIIVLVAANAYASAPSTYTQSVTYNGETITLNMTKHSVRGSYYEVKVQDATGSYSSYTAPEVRTYVGCAAEYPDSWAVGVLLPSGDFKAKVYFDRGITWYTLNNSVINTRGSESDDKEAWPTLDITPSGFAGSDTYNFDVAVDYSYEIFSTDGQSDIDFSLCMIDYSMVQTKLIYLMDALLHPSIARVVIRTSSDYCPYYEYTGSDQLSAARTAWQSDQTDAERDAVCGVVDLGGGYAWRNTMCGSSSYSVNDSASEGDFDLVFRHELAHNWSVYDFHANSCEGKTINCGNSLSRFSGSEAYYIMNKRNEVVANLDNIGVYTNVALPPYASLDTVGEVYTSQSTTVDVLANDYDVNGDGISILSFDTESGLGGSISLSSGTGAGGRDELTYTAPNKKYGFDSFKYVIQDSSGKTQTGKVFLNVLTVSVDSIVTDADSYVRDNYRMAGDEDTIVVKRISDSAYSSYNRTGWVHFDISGISLTNSSQLVFTIDEDSNPEASDNMEVWGIIDGEAGDELGTDWQEDTIRLSNAPITIPFTEGNGVTYLGAVACGLPGEKMRLRTQELQGFLEADTNGEVTFLLTRTDAYDNEVLELVSKEGSAGNAPRLETLPASALDDADAYVRGGSYDSSNFGDATTLEVKYEGVNDTYTRECYLRFNMADTPVQSAVLTLTPSYLQANGNGTAITVKLLSDADDSWLEEEIAYDGRPVGTGETVTFYKGFLSLNTPYDIDVTSLVNQSFNENEVASFHITSNAAYHIKFNSMEAGSNVPTLTVVTYPVGDINLDGFVDLEDFALFSKQWLVTDCYDLDCELANLDGEVGIIENDLVLLASNWLMP